MEDFSNIERQQMIFNIIKNSGRASVKDLSKKFNISEVTIRFDLNKLAKKGRIARTHGGAIYIEGTETDTEEESKDRYEEGAKEYIGKAAASFVKNKDVIFIGGSTTVTKMIPHIVTKKDVTIITNSIEVICRLADTPHIHILSIGGKVNRETRSMVNYSFDDILQTINVGKVFLGADGFTIEDGLTALFEEEVEIKKKIIEKSKQIFALVDSTKWGTTSLIKLVETNRIDKMITDSDAPQEMIEQLHALEVETILTGELKNHTLIY